jgi:hypothetical protein
VMHWPNGWAEANLPAAGQRPPVHPRSLQH